MDIVGLMACLFFHGDCQRLVYMRSTIDKQTGVDGTGGKASFFCFF